MNAGKLRVDIQSDEERMRHFALTLNPSPTRRAIADLLRSVLCATGERDFDVAMPANSGSPSPPSRVLDNACRVFLRNAWEMGGEGNG